PSGRPMPQENGLSIHQMCQAIQSLGFSPYLIKVGAISKSSFKAYLHSAILSGFAPILIIERIEFDNSGDRVPTNLWHAVTVTGMKTRNQHLPNIVATIRNNDIDDLSGDLEAIYVNDDGLS